MLDFNQKKKYNFVIPQKYWEYRAKYNICINNQLNVLNFNLYLHIFTKMTFMNPCEDCPRYDDKDMTFKNIDIINMIKHKT